MSALHDLVSFANLTAVWKEYKPRAERSTPGVDGITARQFGEDLTKQIHDIRGKVAKGYTFSRLRGVPVPKKDTTKFRMICIPTIQDRVVQRALLRKIESKATGLRIANDVSFGFVRDTPGRKRGTVAARAAAIRHRQAKPWAFKADIAAFFDRIDRQDLTTRFRASFRLTSLTPLVESAIACEVDDRDHYIKRVLSDNGIKCGRGLRQGMPLSPILSNFLLRDFDRALSSAGYDLVRYADDLIVLASTREECAAAEALTRAELSKLDLEISEGKTEIWAPDEPVEFLGMELGLRRGASTYCLTISDGQMGKIHERFKQFHDVDFAIREGLDLPKLIQRLENMKSGYYNAYGIADNFQDFRQRLDQWVATCITKVYASMFDKNVIERPTAKQRSFLLLPPRRQD